MRFPFDPGLHRRQSIRHRHREPHRLHPQPRIDPVEPFLQQPDQVPRLPRRPRRPNPDPLGCAVDTLEHQIQPPRALSGSFQNRAHIRDQAGDDGGEGLAGEQRLQEGQACLDRFGREGGFDRLRHTAQRLIQPGGEQRAEAADQRRARHRGQGADLLDPHQPQPVQRFHRQSQRRQRQFPERGFLAARWHHRDLPRAEPRQRMRRPRRIRHRRPRRETARQQPAEQIAQQPCLPAMQVRGAGHVDPHPVRRRGGGQRRVAQTPAREAMQRRLVVIRPRVHHRQIRDQRACLRQRHAGPQSGFRRGGVHRGNHPPPPVMRRGDQHGAFWKPVMRRHEPQPIRRPRRQPK